MDRGQSPWIDYLSRPFLQDGEFGALVNSGIVGVTSNPTIFQGAIAEGDAYDGQLRDLLQRESDPKELFLALAQQDVQRACDVLRNVFDAGRAGARDGWVSLEVDPNLAYQPEETIAAGISVNITLLFSLERHCAAAEAYIRRLRRWLKAGGDLFSVASVASFFVSRVDTEADRRLEHAEGYDDLKGALAIADAKLAYQTYRRLFSGSEWAELQAAGASPQRCLWASTSTKNPDYQDVRYVERLIGPDTVNTMPRETIDAFIDHGQVRPTLTAGVDDARQTLQRFSQAGLDYDDIVAVLEREGVEKFASSFRSMLDAIDAKRPELTAA